MQLKDINRGAFGVVVLAEERTTGEQVAIKFIKRGPKVKILLLCAKQNYSQTLEVHHKSLSEYRFDSCSQGT